MDALSESESDQDEVVGTFLNVDELCAYYDDDLWQMYTLVLEYCNDNYINANKLTYFDLCQHVVVKREGECKLSSAKVPCNTWILHQRLKKVCSIYDKTVTELDNFLFRLS
jgi:hypothetical protein